MDDAPNDQVRVKGTKKLASTYLLCDCGTGPYRPRWKKVVVPALLGGIGLAGLWDQNPIFLICFALLYPCLAVWWWRFSAKHAASLLESTGSFEPAPYDIPTVPSDSSNEDLVTIVKCSTVLEADRIVRLLDQANIRAVIPNKWHLATESLADLRNCYPHIQVRVPRKCYSAARQAIMGVV
ncbi:MAG: hypothetical protein JWM99_2015 [Verrucomicrobiales bacterium]|nr:hypothetical protein [Verrucomicrobiales bacterium]